VELAQRLGDPFNLAYAGFFEFIVHSLRRDLSAQAERAAEVIALSEANGFPLLLGAARVWNAAARVAGSDTAAIADLLAGLALMAESGTQSGAPGIFSLLGETYLIDGQFAEARGAVETGLAIAAQTKQPGADSPLHRLQGEIVLRTADGPESRDRCEQAAEECFHRALAIARAHGARFSELQGAISLARLWLDQGKRGTSFEASAKAGAARDLLAPVYGWFTEGFATRDMIDAKALLNELAPDIELTTTTSRSASD
jgi:predicted ATPase